MSFALARKKAGLTQAEVAKHLKITDAAVAQWETGKTFPRTEFLPQLAKLYGVTIDELFKDEKLFGEAQCRTGSSERPTR